MSNKAKSLIESSYRALYGKLFSALMKQFGVHYIDEIEDAIQSSFLKSLKTWNANKTPANRENWLFVVARNDLLNQLKKKSVVDVPHAFNEFEEEENSDKDLRLQTILFLSSSKRISEQAKVFFILKNIFGLSVREINESTLISQDAIYKSINRAKSDLLLEFKNKPLTVINRSVGEREIMAVEEILYAVFNIGFDSFREKSDSVINDDLCLEALALAKLLYHEYKTDTTRNLLALFCFHIARMPARVESGKLISFFYQDRTKWNKDLMNLGFSYLQKPEILNRFYIEALIACHYMITNTYDNVFWCEVVNLYELLLRYSYSPIVKLNLCYALYKAIRTEDALKLLIEIESELPKEHLYLSLVKATLLQHIVPTDSEKIIASVINKMTQDIRKDYLLDRFYTMCLSDR